ncbi:DUF4870 domain-containing protein [Nodosilinea sp. LEGE 07088]|uniref:DUF4870 domain-containing protein n=1 Tax=Nodosilinea sp. LEGE 07088 TaxID=2777968 RepID=UPI001882C4FC|nr:DUF4870 domain-containing protein [Nodosilinea sp. LEGE 07088]MBE9137587.1 DUF4870 domain-containing protein [Nodosilinea sp. LEGE 07088]
MTTLIDRARQGDAQAIAHLLTQSMARQGIVARGYWLGVQLCLELEAPTPISQALVVPRIQRGLERLNLTCPLETVWVSGWQVGAATAEWQTGFALGATGPSAVASSAVLASPSPSTSGDGTRIPPPTGTASSTDPQSDRSAIASPAPDRLDPEADSIALSDTTLMALVHLAPLVSYLVIGGQWLSGWPLFWGGSFLLPWRVVAPLVLLLVKGGAPDAISRSADVQRQAKAALNFQLTMVIAWVVTIALMFILVGFLLVIPLALVEMVSCIIAAVQVSEGRSARYLGTIRFVR